MKKFTKRIEGLHSFFVIGTIALLCATLTSNGANRYARGGDWNSTSCWSTTATGATGASVPTSSDMVYLTSGVTVTVTATAECLGIQCYVFYSTPATININDGITLTTGSITYKIASTAGTMLIDVGNGTLNCSSVSLVATTTAGKYCELAVTNGTINVSGNLTSGGVNSLLTCNGTGTINVSGNFIPYPKATFTCGTGTVNLNGAAQNVGGANANYTFYNLTLSGSGEKTFASIYGSGINTEIDGTLTLEGTATCKLTSDMFDYGANASLKYNRVGVTSPAVGIEWESPFTAGGGVIIDGNSEIKLTSAKVFSTDIPLTINNGATLNTQDNKITFGGDFIKNGYFTTGASTIEVNGTSNQTIAAITTLGNLEVTKTGGTATLAGPISVGDLIINGSGGTVDMGTYSHILSGDWELTEGAVLGNTSTIAVYGSFTKTSGTFTPGTSTINWKNPFSDISVIDYYSLTLANISGSTSSYSTTDDITINGNLYLAASNPGATTALLNMGAYTLYLGAAATVTGYGDITGTIERNYFLDNTEYSFSNQYNTLSISSGGTMPTSISVKATIGSAPTNKSDAVLRQYQIIQTGGSNVNMNVKLHYLTSELNSNNEKALVLWNYDIVGGVNQNFTELGKSTYDYDNDYVEITNIPIANFPSSFNNQGYTIAVSAFPTYIWTGLDPVNNTDWSEANNWDPVGVPGTTSNVIIPDGAATYPVVDAINVKTITIESNDAVFDASTYDITVNGGVGAWSDPGGRFICGEKKVNFTNAEATITGISTFYDLNIADGGKLTINTDAHITITHSITTNTTGEVDAISNPNTIEYLNNGTAVTMPNSISEYYHLILNGANTMPTAPITVYGDFLATGNATNTAQAAVITKGDFTVDFSSEFATGDNTLTFGGNFVNYGTFTNSASDINFAYDTDEQYIDAFETVGTVKMAKTNGVVYLNGNIMTGNLEMNGSGGAMDLGFNEVTILGDVVLTDGYLLSQGSTIYVLGTSNTTWSGDGSLFDIGFSNVLFMADGDQKITATSAQFDNLLFLGTGTKTIAAPVDVYTSLYIAAEDVTTDSKDLTVYGTFTIDVGGQFTAGISATPVTHHVYADFTNNGTYNATNASTLLLESNFDNEADFISSTNSTLSMSSTFADQLIISASDLGLYNLTQNNTGGGKLYLYAAVNVDGALNLSSGNIVTTSTEIINMTDNATTSPVSGSVESWVEGPMTKSGTAAYVFPIGTENHWAPAAIGAPTSSSTFYAEYHDAAHADCLNYIGDLTKVSDVEYWDIDRTVGTGNTSVKLFWKDAAYSKIYSPSELKIAHYNGSAWESVSNSDYDEDATHLFGDIYSTTNLTSFSPFTFGTTNNVSNPLPVEIIVLSATCENSSVIVSWTTASETNNNYFVVESSKDNAEWNSVGKVDGAGNSNSIRSYRYTDETPDNAIYYRLKQVNFDGTFSYSKTIYVACMNEEEFINNMNIYPNPANSIVNIEGTPIGTHYYIYNSQGRLVNFGTIESELQIIDISRNASGLYNIILKYNNLTVERKIIKE